MPTVPVSEVALLAGIVSGSSACACLTDSRQRFTVIIVKSSKRGSFSTRGTRNAIFATLHINDGLPQRWSAAARLGLSDDD